MASTESFRSQIGKFFHQVKEGETVRNFTVQHAANPIEAMNSDCSTAPPKSSDVIVLINANNCVLNVGGDNNYYSTQKKKEDPDVITLIDSDDSDLDCTIVESRTSVIVSQSLDQSSSKFSDVSGTSVLPIRTELQDQQLKNSSSFSTPSTTVIINNRRKPKPKWGVKRKSKVTHHCSLCERKFTSEYSFKMHCDYNCRFQKKYDFVCKLCGRKYANPETVWKHLGNIHDIISRKEQTQLTVTKPVNNVEVVEENDIHVRHNLQQKKTKINPIDVPSTDGSEKLDSDPSPNGSEYHMVENIETSDENDRNDLYCYMCNCEFHNTTDLLGHWKNDLCGESTIFPCKFCSKTFTNQKLLSSHKCKNSKTSSYFCSKCKKKYVVYGHYSRHQQKCMSNNLVSKSKTKLILPKTKSNKSSAPAKLKVPYDFFKCGICNEGNFLCLSYFQRHIENHKKLKIICTKCDKTFDRYLTFRQHLKTLNYRLCCGDVDLENDELEIAYSNFKNSENSYFETINKSNSNSDRSNNSDRNLDTACSNSNSDTNDTVTDSNTINDNVDTDNNSVINDENNDHNDFDSDDNDNDDFPFICSYCKRKFSEMSILIKHIQIKHISS